MINHVLRLDAVLTEKTRMTFKTIKDRDDDWRWNAITPGTGFVNQNTPGILLSSTVTQVLTSSVVNELNFGYTHNRWGFKAADDFDYRSLYRSTLGIDPPRFEPYTLAKGEGYMGYDPYTDEVGGKDAIKARYWGPTPNDRRHNLVINYSYIVPTFVNTPERRSLK